MGAGQWIQAFLIPGHPHLTRRQPKNRGVLVLPHKETIEKRQELLKKLVGGQMPRLWCPPLTHYTANGELDRDRMEAHWAVMTPHVNSFLVPGSTGDAWEMAEPEVRSLLEFAIELAKKYDALLLIGVLASSASAMCQTISEILATLKQKTGMSDSTEALKESRVCGFTVCPPHGSKLTQDEIRAALETVLALGLPTALYQLPQVTLNEMSPTLVAQLAVRYPNLILLKDTSGNDRVALSDDAPSNVFFVRGAEGRYTEWLRESGGPYHGLLLSTANCFSSQLKAIVTLLEQGKNEEARDLSDRLTRVVELVFGLVNDLPDGNAFANANKAMDHFMAYGPNAEQISPPRLHTGAHLPEEVILQTATILKNEDLIPSKGYLDL